MESTQRRRPLVGRRAGLVGTMAHEPPLPQCHAQRFGTVADTAPQVGIDVSPHASFLLGAARQRQASRREIKYEHQHHGKRCRSSSY
jgi:hypothetical protein